MRRAAFTSLVLPVATYGAEIWYTPTKTMKQKLDNWQTNQISAMAHCPPKTPAPSLQRELGFIPLHLTITQQLLTMWHRIQDMPSSQLTKHILNAWTGPTNPWTQRVHALINHHLGTTPTQAANKTRAAFKTTLRQKILEHTLETWQTAATTSPTYANYTQAFGTAHNTKTVNHPQPYIQTLSHARMSTAAELCLKLRTECIQLRGTHTAHKHRDEPAIDYKARTTCPTCKSTRETISHFLLECPTHTSARQTLYETLLEIDEQKATVMMQITDPDTQWRTLLNPTHWDSDPHSDQNTFKKIATYAISIWKTRSQLLHTH